MNWRKIRVLTFITLIFLYLFSNPVNVYLISQEESPNKPSINENFIKVYNTTRKQAIIDFVAALQMKDGGFVSDLIAPEEEEDTCITMDAVYVLAHLNALDAVDKEAIINYVARCQTDDGGFIGTLWWPEETEPDIVDAEVAAYILYQLNAFDKIDRDALLNWILKCYNEDGGFGCEPGEPSSFIHTIEGVSALFWLGELNKIDREKTINFILSYYEEDGSFSGFFSSDVDTFHAVLALLRLGALNRIDREKTINFYMSYYDEEEQLFKLEIGAPLPVNHYPVIVLSLLGGLNRINVSRMVDLILSCQSPWYGGFATSPEDIYEEEEVDVDPTRVAVEMLEALDALDVLNDNFTVKYKPVWHGEPYVPSEDEEGEGGEGNMLNLTLFDCLVLATCIISFAAIYFLLKRAVKYRRRLKRLKKRKTLIH